MVIAQVPLLPEMVFKHAEPLDVAKPLETLCTAKPAPELLYPVPLVTVHVPRGVPALHDQLPQLKEGVRCMTPDRATPATALPVVQLKVPSICELLCDGDTLWRFEPVTELGLDKPVELV
jgi:hypothetical protein